MFVRAVELFLEFKLAEGLSRRTVRWYSDQLLAFAAVMADRDVCDVSAVDVARYLASERDRGLAASTVEGRYRALLAFFNWAEDFDELGCPASPLGHGRRKRVKRPRVGRPQIQHVTFAEYQQLIATIDLASWLDYRDYCICGVLFWCGLRRSECADLHLADLDLLGGLLQVRSGKGNKARAVPADGELCSALLTYLNCRPRWDGPELWLAYDHGRAGIRGGLSSDGIRQMLERRCERAGMRRLNAHAWRHGFAMSMLNGGAEMSSVSAMMGHSSQRVTESTYARWQMSGLRRQYMEAAKRIKSTQSDL